MRVEPRGKVNIENRRYRCGACFVGYSGRTSTDTRQARHKPDFVEEIGEVSEWAGLDYDYGDRASVCAAWMVFLKISFIGPATGGPHHPYLQAWFRIEDVFLLELTVTLARHVPDTRQELFINAIQPPSSPLHPPPVLRPAVLAKFSQVMCIGVLPPDELAMTREKLARTGPNAIYSTSLDDVSRDKLYRSCNRRSTLPPFSGTVLH